MREQARQIVKDLQDTITDQLNILDDQSFAQDIWQRPGGGGGDTRVYSGGKVFEKAGVNFSEVHGQLPEDFAKTLPFGEGTEFFATGTSLVLHPKNPFVPTVHANYRYIERGGVGWFGGGADLTPYYLFPEDAQHFHQTYKKALDPFGSEYYAKFKQECDEYFYLQHRKEARGVGGIFFDYLAAAQSPHMDLWKACGESFIGSYLPIAERRESHSYEGHHKEFQEIRRGRYVEFNLVYDRGTVFGLKTGGRIESILMSLPLKAQWPYNFRVEEGSEEAKLVDVLQNPRDWV